jgi:hypothetical protein
MPLNWNNSCGQQEIALKILVAAEELAHNVLITDQCGTGKMYLLQQNCLL